MEGIALPSLLCFNQQKVERRAHLCTSTYRVLVHFYLFTEWYFQYTAVQFYFVEIWYIELIEGVGGMLGKVKTKFSGWWHEERGNASGTNHDHTSLLSFLQMNSKCLVLLTIVLPLSQIYLLNHNFRQSWFVWSACPHTTESYRNNARATFKAAFTCNRRF